jgi:hypothetical protein
LHRPKTKRSRTRLEYGALAAFVKLSTEANDIALAEVQALIFLPSTTFYQEKEVEPHQSGKLCQSRVAPLYFYYFLENSKE